MTNKFLEQAGVEHPIIGGPMFPCSNPELVAAVSEQGGIGIMQPLSLTYVHKFDLREGIRYMRSLTDKPIGFNALIEKSSSYYLNKMKGWVDIALEEGIRFFVTSLGKPDWVVDKVKAQGGFVYHDVTNIKWAKVAMQTHVDGFICVNNLAGGHLGEHSPEKLYQELKDLGLPMVCAGGVGGREQYRKMLDIGYQAVQMGTRFIATKECSTHLDYKNAIVEAKKENIVTSKNLTGVNLAVIRLDSDKSIYNWIVPKLLNIKFLSKKIRPLLSLVSLLKFKQANAKGGQHKGHWSAGKSVEDVNKIQTVSEVFSELLQ